MKTEDVIVMIQHDHVRLGSGCVRKEKYACWRGYNVSGFIDPNSRKVENGL